MLLNVRRLNRLNLILLVTEKLRIEAQERARMGELQHRVKNILANVRALFALSRRHSRTVEDFATSFERRLASLARTQDLVSNPSDSVTLGGFDQAMLYAIDQWRRQQTPIPTVSDAIRALVERGLAAKPEATKPRRPVKRGITGL
jgi:two-component sensor histidine kinase